MKIAKLRKNVLAIAAGAVMALGASQAMADAPQFTINPGFLDTTASAFVANQILGSSSELLHTTATGHNASGWLQMSGFSLNGNPVKHTGIVDNYGLYVTFQLADTLSSGGLNGSNSVNTLTLLNFQFWADPGSADTFTKADATNGTEAVATDVGNNDVLLGVGTLVSGLDGFNAQGGAYLNSSENFAICSGAGTALVGGVPATGATATQAAACKNNFGLSFFAAPTPFYSMAFDALNNTGQGPIINPVTGQVSINNAAGTVDFNVPEPATLALLGLGLLGVSATRSRRKS